MLSNHARWPEPNAGWRDGMCVEAYLALDFFPRPDDQIVFNDWVIPSGRTGFFLHHSGTSRKAGAKRTKEK
jgi:hypothetical protein